MPDTPSSLNHLSLYPLAIGGKENTLSTNSVQTLLAISHSIENTVMKKRIRCTFYAGFQRLSAFLPQINRFRRLAAICGEAIVFGIADAPVPDIPGVQIIPLAADAPLAEEWFIVVETPEYRTALLTHQLTPGNGEAPSAAPLFGRGRDYEGAVSFDGDLTIAARQALDAALGRPAAPTLAGQANIFDPNSPYSLFSRNLVTYLEGRNQEITSLYTSLNIRNQELIRLQNVVRKMVSQTAWEVAQQEPSGAPDVREETLTVLFTDVEGFTRLAESLPPAALFGWLNRYLDMLATTVYQNHGDVDKFMGDGMMAFFKDPHHALETAYFLQRRIEVFNSQQVASRAPMFRTRIGIATGPCRVGRIGSRARQDVTLIGDTVNTAARLQALAPTGGLLMDEITYKGSGAPLFALQTSVNVRGKSNPKLVHEIPPEDWDSLQSFLKQAK